MKFTPKKLFLLLFLSCFLFASGLWAEGPKLDSLPAPVSNNAVAVSYGDTGTKIFSFMGIGAKKTWDAATNGAYELDVKTGKWEERRPVTGVVGRLEIG